MAVFKRISDVLEEKKEPLNPENLLKDVKLAKEGDYSVESTLTSQGALDFQLPDITQPFRFAYVEAGVAVIEGFGTITVPFKKSFNSTPALLKANFGFVEIRVPWVNINWRTYTLGWYSFNIPIPSVTWMTVRIPTMLFLMNVNSSGFQILNVLGRTYVSYLAIAD